MHGGQASTAIGGGADTIPASKGNLGSMSEGLGGVVSSLHPLLETLPPTIFRGTTSSLNVSGECLSIPSPFTPSFGVETESLLLEVLGELMGEGTHLIDADLVYTSATGRLGVLSVPWREW